MNMMNAMKINHKKLVLKIAIMDANGTIVAPSVDLTIMK